MKCPGCGTELLETMGYWSSEVRGEPARAGLMEDDASATEHTSERCRTASGVAALGDKVRDALAWLDDAEHPRSPAERNAASCLRSALGALR